MKLIPLDLEALDGAGKTLQAQDGTRHAGHWNQENERFEYSNGQPIGKAITHYLSRKPAPYPEVARDEWID